MASEEEKCAKCGKRKAPAILAKRGGCGQCADERLGGRYKCTDDHCKCPKVAPEPEERCKGLITDARYDYGTVFNVCDNALPCPNEHPWGYEGAMRDVPLTESEERCCGACGRMYCNCECKGGPTTSAELKPCPFCGETASIVSFGKAGEIDCDSCNAHMSGSLMDGELIAAWNRRPAPAPISEAGER